MFTHLVILGSTVTALAVVRDAHAHGLRPIVLDTGDGIAFRSRYAIACRPADASDAAVLAALRAHAGPESALVATGDPWVRFVIRQRAALDAMFGAVLHPGNAALEICLDKRRFAAWCSEHGLDTPRSWLAGAEPRPAELRCPVLVRPAETLHGRPHHGLPKAEEVRTEAELESLLARFDSAGCKALVSESLLGQQVTQYSVPFARGRGELISFVARKVRPAPERCSVGTFVELSPQPEVEALARRAVEALDYFGVGEVEILHAGTTGRICLIEINARPWLQYALAPASGHDFLGLLLERRRGDVQIRRQGLRWTDLRSDLFGALSASEGSVRRGELGLVSYLLSLARVNVHARFHWRDPAPALHSARPSASSELRPEDSTTKRAVDAG